MKESAIIYKRKSSESEDRQMLSLESQDRVIKESIPELKTFNIIQDLSESKSAKEPGRPLFSAMCAELEAGKAKYIVCWHLNRLARNPVDGGRIIWLVQHHGVKIITPGKTYGEDDVLLMYVEFAMSNQFITDLSKSTKRGMGDKLKAGVAPFLAPAGYLNDKYKPKGMKDIIVDPERFDLVRKMWDLFLTGNYSPVAILRIATDEWGLRQRNGKPLSRTNIYHLFNDIFYTGKFYYVGQLYQGSHKAMITMEEFEKGQRLLGGRALPKLTTREFALAGNLLHCECGASITGEEKYRKYCRACHKKFNTEKHAACPTCGEEILGEPKRYCYYHCTRKKDIDCRQPAITEAELNRQIDEQLAAIEIPQEFADWALNQLRKVHEAESSDRQSIEVTLHSSIQRCATRLDSLFTKYISEANVDGSLISEDEYKHHKGLIEAEKAQLEEQLLLASKRQQNWLQTAEGAFNFAVQARYWFEHGSKEDRRVIATSLGLNLKLVNRIFCYDLKKPLEAAKSAHDELHTQNKRFEPKEFALVEGKYVSADGKNSNWGG